MNQFSVLMSVYRNDKPEFVRVAIESVTTRQTLKPSEVVLVVDGPVSDALANVIKEYENAPHSIFKVIWLPKNQGLGNALRIGMDSVSNEIVARMDADDIAVADRFEKQICFLNIHPEIAVLGGQISEFIDSPDNIVGQRIVPLESDECKAYYQDRDPLNHMTVMFRKSAVMSVGNYMAWHLDEDSFLWGRILKAGYKIANIKDVLVYARVGKDMYARRGGWKYFKSDSLILKWKLDQGLTSRSRYIYNYAIRFIVQVVIPNRVRGFVFKNLLRSRK